MDGLEFDLSSPCWCPLCNQKVPGQFQYKRDPRVIRERFGVTHDECRNMLRRGQHGIELLVRACLCLPEEIDEAKGRVEKFLEEMDDVAAKKREAR